ncbi:hypothetical protein RFI_19591 [Reticulomyxa filosa]|uniref:Exoribonuclease phosphorolytic domain-containing protein n=1 Tax=Reticulomyxa filosa TaxID=46433 RepID=X6MV50_RETFI|nr:hypothetical protein RFI_19591 [Reticulomyxa filosa]|eukprot:ETO17724.1 hypothetical protein RFI_19591 [Reticulomyxa filosa]
MATSLSESGLREDGRRPHEVRRVECKLCVFPHADGSAEFRLGATHVIATVFGPRQASTKAARVNEDGATITCRVQSCEFSQSDHRQANKFRRRDRLLGDLIAQTFQCAVMTNLYAKSSIDICIEILTNDGDINSAAINAACLALINAGICMKDYVVACSAGFIAKSTRSLKQTNKTGAKTDHIMFSGLQGIVDLNQQEKNLSKHSSYSSTNISEGNESGLEMCNGIVTVAMMPNSGEIVTLEMQSVLPLSQMEKLLSFAKKGINSIHTQMAAAVKKHSFMLLERKGFIGS